VHHVVIITPTSSLLPLRGAAVCRAPTILPIDQFCIRFSSFLHHFLSFFPFFPVRNRLLDQYFVTGFLGRFVSNYWVLDIPDTGSSTGFKR